MASIMKRGDSYSVRYKYKDHSGKPCEGWESFKTKKEAQERKITVEKELLDGTFLVPDTMTVEEMLYKWIPIQSTKHKWSPKTYTQSVAMVQNMFFVGCLGDTAQVAAVSVVGPVFSILAAVATMLGAGSSAIIARCFGAGEIEQGRICSSLCFWTSFFLGVLVSIGLLVGRVPLLGMLGSNAEIFPYAERYLQVLALGAPFFILSNSMAMLVRAEGAAKEGMIGNLLGTLVNCIFDPLFILVLNFGVSGAAAASVLGNLVATACYLRYIVKHGTVLTVDFRPALKKPQIWTAQGWPLWSCCCFRAKN